MNKRYLIICLLIFIGIQTWAQAPQDFIFKDRRLVFGLTTETLPDRMLDVRIGHHFGDFAGSAGGWQSFYGLENAADISIGLEYGLMENLTLALNRTKGAGPLRQLINFSGKWKFAHSEGDKPLAVALIATVTASTMEKSDNTAALNYFPKFGHRFVYHAELTGARKFSESFSLLGRIGYVHRNYVAVGDENELFVFGTGVRFKITPTLGILAEMDFPLSASRNEADSDYRIPLGFGLEWETKGGHVFQLNLQNSRGLIETDYLPYSTSSWSDGEFRLGFTISRLFKT